MTTTLFKLEQQFTTWTLFFFAYAFIGWLWESGYVSVQKKRWTNSGFLNGPIIPVYGFSMTAVLAAIAPFQKNLVTLYVLSCIVITLIEYITSWLMEKLFNARWWDYSKVPLNLNGRVALPISLFWGAGMVLIVKFVHPLVSNWVAHIAGSYGIFASILLTALTMFDLGFTLANMLAFGAATKRIGDAIEVSRKNFQTKVDEAGAKLEDRRWLEDFRQDAKKRADLPHLSYVQRRLLRSFPNLKLHTTQTPAKDISALADMAKKLGKRSAKAKRS